jgi:hypothetical protein
MPAPEVCFSPGGVKDPGQRPAGHAGIRIMRMDKGRSVAAVAPVIMQVEE